MSRQKLRWPIRIIPRPYPEHRYMAEAFRAALQPDRADCPKCKAGLLRPTGDAEARTCDRCGAVVTLDDLAIMNGPWLEKTAAQRIDYFRRHARLMRRIIIGWLLMAAAASIVTGSPQILLGAVLLAVPIGASALSMRYRAWQLAENRLYEARAPLGDFMRAELNGLVSGR